MPADEWLTPEEIDAVVLLRNPSGFDLGQRPTLGQVVRWIADIGGCMGGGKNRPPGKIVIGRGLERIASAVTLLELLRRRKRARDRAGDRARRGER